MAYCRKHHCSAFFDISHFLEVMKFIRGVVQIEIIQRPSEKEVYVVYLSWKDVGNGFL